MSDGPCWYVSDMNLTNYEVQYGGPTMNVYIYLSFNFHFLIFALLE